MTNYIYLGESDGTHYCSNTTILSLLGNESDGYYIEPYGIDAGDSVYSLVYYPSPYSPRLASKFVEKEFAYSLFDDGIMIAPGADLVLRDFSDDKPLPKVENIVYDGATGSVNADFVHAVNADASDLVVIGQDAKYDDAGNITDYGNVTVPDVFAPNYTAPGSYGDALDQMNAPATTKNPAHADSPSFGQSDTTVKDWVDENQTPKPDPSDQTAQDGFKVEDLEKVFPFCIPWDLYYLLSMFAAEPVAPHIAWPFDFGDLGKFDLDIDLSEFESVAAVVRTCETVLFCVGLAFATRELVRG